MAQSKELTQSAAASAQSPMDQTSRDADSGFQRVLGPFSATCVVVGAIIGIGIFFTPQAVARTCGSAELAMLAWVIGGAIALVGALTFAELGSLYSRTAGQYEILRDAYGSIVGFVYVFCNATIVQAGAIAIIAYYSALNLGVFLLEDGNPGYGWNLAVAVIAIVFISAANLIGVRWGAMLQNASVVLKVGALLAITVLAIAFTPRPFVEAASVASPATPPDSPPVGLLGVLPALTATLFSYGGWQQALWVGGEIQNPRRNVPRAIVLGVLIVIATYLLVNWAYFQLLTYAGVASQQSKALAADAVGQVFPDWGRRAVALAVALSGFGVLNAQLLTGPRLICGMARDGKFFSMFAKVSPRFGTPIPAVLLLGGMGLMLLLGMESIAFCWSLLSGYFEITTSGGGKSGVDYIDSLTNGVVMVDSVLFLLTGLALIVLRRRFLEAPHAIRMPFFPLIPLLFAIGEAAVLVGAFLEPKYRDGAYIGLVWIAVAIACYLWFFMPRGAKKLS